MWMDSIWVPTTGDSKLVDTLLSRSIPAVSIVRKLQGNPLPTIVFEDLAGARAATHHLIQLGHTRIGLIGGDAAHSSNYDRLQGYLKALEEASLEPDPALIKMGSSTGNRGFVAAEELLQLASPPSSLSSRVMP